MSLTSPIWTESPPPGIDWRAVVDALPAPAAVLDANGNVLHHNTHILDLVPKMRTGLPISGVVRNPDFLSAIDRMLAPQHVGGPELATVEIAERVPVERRYVATLSRIRGSERQIAGPLLLVTIRDLSEQDKLEQMRADFIANASHELRTPLASLRGFVETLQGPARDDPQARDRFLSIMANQSERMTRLIDDLLSLSRAEMRAHLPPRGTVDLNETCAFVVQTLEPLAAASKVAVSLERLPGPALVRGERDELVQVFQNLLQNAIKYGYEGGSVRVRLSVEPAVGKSGARYSAAIIDNGPGIAPEHLPRLTERFYRANVASSREKGGTGLGLAIVKHIVNRHRGDLRIQSTVGVGSTFAVSFEALKQNSAAQPV